MTTERVVNQHQLHPKQIRGKRSVQTRESHDYKQIKQQPQTQQFLHSDLENLAQINPTEYLRWKKKHFGGPRYAPLKKPAQPQELKQSCHEIRLKAG